MSAAYHDEATTSPGEFLRKMFGGGPRHGERCTQAPCPAATDARNVLGRGVTGFPVGRLVPSNEPKPTTRVASRSIRRALPSPERRLSPGAAHRSAREQSSAASHVPRDSGGRGFCNHTPHPPHVGIPVGRGREAPVESATWFGPHPLTRRQMGCPPSLRSIRSHHVPSKIQQEHPA